MFGADKGDKSQLLSNGRKLYIGIVQSRFNANITDALKAACIAELKSMGVAEKHLDMYQVAGALELGVTLQALAEKNEYDALIAIGCVIRGETYHFELVANESAAAITRISLDYKLPIINAVLTTENEAQAHERLEEKGKDAAHVAVEMANLINELA